MMKRRSVVAGSLGALALWAGVGVAEGQDRLKAMPGYPRFQEKSRRSRARSSRGR